MSQAAKRPVTLITGFLGAGKTTFLNELIQQHPATRFAILENEFGEIPIDQELVLNADEGIFEMSNGCICCQLNDELLVYLDKLAKGPYSFDHLLIETTGIAEPGGVAAAFVDHPYFELDGSICLADAADIEANLEETEEAPRQIAFADAILLNKTDLVTKEDLQRLRAVLYEANPFAQVFECAFAKVPGEPLLQLGAYRSGDILERTRKIYEAPEDHGHHHTHSSINSLSFLLDEPLDMLKFQHWVNVLLLIQGASIYRIKGILYFEGMEEKFVFQSVRKRFVMSKAGKWEENELKQTRLVFIGRNLNPRIVGKGLKNCSFTAV